MIVTLPHIMADLSAMTAEETTNKECLTSYVVNNNLSYLPKDTGTQDIGTIDAFAKGKQWLLGQLKALTCLLLLRTGVLVVSRTPESRLVFVSILPIPICLLSREAG